MPKIKTIKAKQILDSRGSPTVEVTIKTNKGLSKASVPSGASKGKHEALELRDKDGSVKTAAKNVNAIIAKKLVGKNPLNQSEIDELMIRLDGAENKSRLGANAILGVSMAVCRAGAKEKGIPLYKHISQIAEIDDFILPVPSLNIINGGRHAKNNLDIQEYMILPIGAKTFREAMQMAKSVYNELKKIIKSRYGKINIGDEGGFAPPLSNIREPFELIQEAIDKSGYNGKIRIGIDAAASEFYKNRYYILQGKKLPGNELMSKYIELANEYGLISIEDPFNQEDFKSFSKLTREIGNQTQIVGDDLLVTNIKRIKKAIQKKACNALLLKINQIGTISEAINAAKLAQSKNWGVMVSHRSGETTDSFIADLAVGIKAGQIKSGAPYTKERLAKYNRLIKIEKELGNQAKYAGKNFRKP